jgi:polyphosphate kinase
LEAESLSRNVPASAAVFDLNEPSLYLNRELSWLEFNRRVLAEALDDRNPLLERVKFLAICASNLDEFLAKRLGWLQLGLRSDHRVRTVDGLTIGEQMDLVIAQCNAMRHEMQELWCDVLTPLLAAKGVRVLRFEQLDEGTRAGISAYFKEAIFPVLTPLVVDPAHPFPFISSGSLSLALNVRHPGTGVDRFARVKVPQNRPRFIEAGDLQFVLIEDVIAAHVQMLFPGMDVPAWNTLRVIRSAEIGSPGEESDDLLELIESELRRRRLASAVTIEIAGKLPANRVELLLEELGLRERDVFTSPGPLGLADLMQIATLPLPELSEAAFVPAIPSSFMPMSEPGSVFSEIRERDILVHHPFESFDATVARFVEEAANDPLVLAIKQTMYRTSPDSPILASLIDAAGRGKQVAVLVELTARFDEANNIEWARKLEDAGVHVAYGNPNLKIHAKSCLVVREEANGVKMYAHIGTGNYNSRTARLYTDIGLFTADPGICSDLVHVFNYLTGFADRLESEHLLVAPANLRAQLKARVKREIEAARAGKPARCVFKINALEDREFTRLLYKASQAGVKVDLIIRGICRLRPGIPGLSENVRVVSVIGRFLEHSRVYMFENGGEHEYFIGSADVMKRNLDERIEVLTPIRQPDLQQHLGEALEVLLGDRRQGWELRDSTWTRERTEERGTHATLLGLAPFS